MKLPDLRISTKVSSMMLSELITALVVGFVTQSPLKDNVWLAYLQDPVWVCSLLFFVSGVTGWNTEEKAFDYE